MIEQYKSVRRATEDFCAPLLVEDYVVQPVEYVSPPKWHLGHTTWFFEEFVLSKHVEGYKRFHDDFAFLFNSYYNNVGDRVRRNHRGMLTRPETIEVFKYRSYVDMHITRLLEHGVEQEVVDTIELGLNHEQQHQELLKTDTKFILSCHPLLPTYRKDGKLIPKVTGESAWKRIEEGLYEIGHSGEGFAYDNELARHKVYLQPFDIATHPVTAGEYLEFISDGGYENFNLWHDEGWAWVQAKEVQAPLYWEISDGQWYQFTLGGSKAVEPDDLLVHVNFYEASAFAEWKGMRLPTEAEWEVASEQFDWGSCWEWTNSAYLPYPGFSKAEGAIGEYNGKFMVNQMVLRGSSVATSQGHSRPTYRNFFHPHFQWQYSGIRLAR